jgi:CRISPR-associated protein Cmr4
MGAGQAIGVIDNPIQRERHTNHPNMAGSGIKGALRHHANATWRDKTLITRLFGPENNASDHAGAVSFGDSQLLAFPVRSLKQAFVYAVSATTLARLRRLAELTGMKAGWSIPALKSGDALVCHKRVLNDSKLVLEAFEFEANESGELKAIAEWIAAKALPDDAAHDYFREKLKTDLVLLPDAALSHFVENATVVEPHVRIDDITGTAADGDLFYTENLPPETLMISPVFASVERYKSKPDDPKDAKQMIRALVDYYDNCLVQVGGGATTGRGQVLLHFAGEDG